MTEQDERYGEDVSSDEDDDVEAHKKKASIEPDDSDDGGDDVEAHKRR